MFILVLKANINKKIANNAMFVRLKLTGRHLNGKIQTGQRCRSVFSRFLKSNGSKKCIKVKIVSQVPT